MPIDFERVSRIVDELEQLVPKDGAIVLVEQYGGGPDESSMRATQAGYLRFGIELIKIGLAPEAETKKGLRPDLDYLIPDRSPVQFDWFERRDIAELAAPNRPHEFGRFASLGCIAVLILFGLLAFTGLLAIIAWLFPRGP
jgi:hypothetical protein